MEEENGLEVKSPLWGIKLRGDAVYFLFAAAAVCVALYFHDVRSGESEERITRAVNYRFVKIAEEMQKEREIQQQVLAELKVQSYLLTLPDEEVRKLKLQMPDELRGKRKQ